MDDYKKVFESFLRAVIGFLAGLVPAALTTTNVIFTVGIIGVCGVVSEFALPRLISNFKGSNFKNLIGLLLVTGISTGVAYEVYMRHDSYGYKPDQELIVTLPSYPTVMMRKYPHFSREVNEKITVLKVGQRVTYLATSPRKSFRLAKRDDGRHYLFEFWRMVKTEDGKVGWVYGEYLNAAH